MSSARIIFATSSWAQPDVLEVGRRLWITSLSRDLLPLETSKPADRSPVARRAVVKFLSEPGSKGELDERGKIALSAAVSFSLLAPVALADNPKVGGAAMYAKKDIVDNAVNSKDHTTLVAAV